MVHTEVDKRAPRVTKMTPKGSPKAPFWEPQGPHAWDKSAFVGPYKKTAILSGVHHI